jgi:hypothetical protein
VGNRKRRIAMKTSKQSWILAALFLIGFCYIGYMAISLRALIKDLGIDLPSPTRFAVAHGPVAFPLFGIFAATAFIISDVFTHNRWVQFALTGLFALIMACALGCLCPGGVWIRSTIQTDHPDTSPLVLTSILRDSVYHDTT